MSFATLHAYFEQQSPHGAGLAIAVAQLQALAKDIVTYLSVPRPAATQPGPGINDNIGLPQYPNIGFSFLIDPATFSLQSGGLLSISLSLWLHPINHSNEPIITQTLSLHNVPINVSTDPTSGDLVWVPKGVFAPAITNVVKGPDANLIDAGYVTQAGAPDWDKFNTDIYYGFIWQTSGNFFAGIVANMPFPQLQQLSPVFQLEAPIQSGFQDDYFVIWSNRVRINTVLCGSPSPSVGNTPTLAWQSDPVPRGQLSRHDADSPMLLMYFAAEQLLSWKASALMPGVVFQQSGGGFVRWGISAAIGLSSLNITLHPSHIGGSITVKGGLVFFGHASAWVDGPSGTRIATITEGVDGNADLTANVDISFQQPTLSVDLDTLVNIAVNRNSVNFTDGLNLPWPFSVIVDDILDILVRSGAIQIPPLYNGSTHSDILSLSKFLKRSTQKPVIVQRVGGGSVLLGIDPDAGLK